MKDGTFKEGEYGDGSYHGSRLKPDRRRDVLWETLWDAWFRHRVPEDGCVLDLGSGYGQFINNAKAHRRIAIDSWPGFTDHLETDVEAHVGDVADLSGIEDGAVDYAFASNLLEHLEKDHTAVLLDALRRKLSPRGSFTLLQPNYLFASKEYFDDYTHVAIWSHLSMSDFLEAHGFEVTEVRPRFLPLTVTGRLPVKPWLIRAYLASPVKPMGKQMLISARPIA